MSTIYQLYMNTSITGYRATVYIDNVYYSLELREGFRGINIRATTYKTYDGTFCVTCQGRKIPVTCVKELIPST